MLVLLNLSVLVGALVFGYIERDYPYQLGIATGLAAYVFANLIARLAILVRGFAWPIVLTSTIYRYRKIRVSISYLVAISVEGEQLLVRGRRITTQFQPVGGVYKTYLSDSQLRERFNAQPDGRFAPDKENRSDLRLRLPGKDVHKLLRWFSSKENRELFPVREFYEELLRTDILDRDLFAYFDCTFMGTKRMPLHYDRYSQLQQLIIADVYELRPSPAQVEALEELRNKAKSTVGDVYFASQDEITHGGSLAIQSTNFDISPTALWLLGK